MAAIKVCNTVDMTISRYVLIGFSITTTVKSYEKYLQVSRTNFFTVISDVYRSFIPNKTTFTLYCLPRSFEIHWVRQYLLHFMGLVVFSRPSQFLTLHNKLWLLVMNLIGPRRHQNSVYIAGPLWGETTSHCGFSSWKASKELWCFLICWPE